MTCSRCSGACTCTAAPDSAPVQPTLLSGEDSTAWRREVSERLHRYQARRKPRGPRYPSLRLKFDGPGGNWGASAPESPRVPDTLTSSPLQPNVTSSALAVEYGTPQPTAEAPVADLVSPQRHVRRHETAKVIEFPVPAYPIEDYSFALAEPMFDRPRILEAPEVVPPPPALGGITIEPDAKAEPERRAGIDMPLQSAPATQRVLAGALDTLIVFVGTGLFAAIFYGVTHSIPVLWQSALAVGGAVAVFWFSYQYLFLVHCGTTPGLRNLRLRLQRFDGKPVGRRLRRARVLCHILSVAALGMGYAWQFLDEDGLCWHERVTKTHMATHEVADS